jgi:DNA-binding XRE family transcriptional regulator
MSAKTWQQMRQEMDAARAAKGLPPRTDRDRQADLDRIRAEARAFQLAELRREQALTQQDVAGSMGVSAPRVSAIERGDVERVELSTLRAYVEALGGRLQVIAEFGDSIYRVA